MERDTDAVVVGAGIVGCATAYFLARRGARVVVVERGPVPGEQSRKNWWFVRQQGRDPLELPLMMEANRLRKPSLDIAGFRFSRFAEGAIGKTRNVL